MNLLPSGMSCREVRYSRHALERMFQRAIPPEVVESLIAHGEIIARYPHDQPYPSLLLLGNHAGTPVHAVVAQDDLTGTCQVITVYRPDPARWDTTFKTRREP